MPRAESPAELHQAILFDLAKPYQGLTEQELRLAVTGHLLDAAVGGAYPTVLVLDEGQHLGRPALEELRLLSNLETRQGAGRYSLCWSRRPALREMLALPGLEPLVQRLAIRASLAPLTAEESASYIRHQVRAAGGEPDRVLMDEAVSILVHACRGVPRLLNRACAPGAGTGRRERINPGGCRGGARSIGTPRIACRRIGATG